ncbi:hypothetical protein ABBQ38_010959 [Trebouxia sp. C0009 RCD-2024]
MVGGTLPAGNVLRACQALVRNPRCWRCLRLQPGWNLVKMQASHHAVSTYHGRQPGFRSSSIAAHAQVGGASPAAPKPEETKDQFCRMCGTKMQLAIPKGEAAWRHVCSSCGYIDYFNPKMVVGCIVEHEGKILLCKRAIEPCKGKWTLPAGYMELKESSAEGAARETWEEANCQVEILAPYSHFDIPMIGQAYILFRAKLVAPYTFSPGEETLQTVLFHPNEIPFDQIAFSSISLALQHYVEDMKRGQYRVHHGVVSKQPGSGPNEIGRFELQDHFAVKTEVPALGKL